MHDSTFCPVQLQRNSWMLSPNERNRQNFYQNDPAPQLMVPDKLTTYVKPHEKSRRSEGRIVRTKQEQINFPILRTKDKQITASHQVSRGKVRLNARTNSEHTRRIKQNHMENEAFLSRYHYGGGKRKSNDSDGDYNPNDAKKLKRKKKSRKDNRKRKKGNQRTLERINAVRVANSKTNPKNNAKRHKGDDRSSEHIDAVQKANLKSNAERPKGDDRSSEHIDAV